METSEIIDIITGKKSANKDDLPKINELITKYPYFETAYNVSLRYYYSELPNEFDKKLSEYSVFVSNRKKLIDDTFFKQVKPITKSKETKPAVKSETEQSETEAKDKKVVRKKREKKPSKMDQIIFDPELYERQKVLHKFVTEDFIVPKAHGYGELRRLLKQENLTEEEFWQSLKDDAEKNTLPNVNAVKDDNRKAKKERPRPAPKQKDVEKEIVEKKKEDAPKDVVKEVAEKKNEVEKNEPKNDIKQEVEKVSKQEEPKKETVKEVVEKTSKKEENKVEPEKDTEKKVIAEKVDDSEKVEEKTITKNDIFSRIAKLKAQKLTDLSNEEENTEKKPEIKDENIVEEKKADTIVENKDEKNLETENQTSNTTNEVSEIDKNEKKDIELADTNKEQIDTDEIELVDENKVEPILLEVKDGTKEEQDEVKKEEEKKDDKEISAADKVLLKLKNNSKKTYIDGDKPTDSSKKDVTAEDILKKLSGKKETSTTDKETMPELEIVKTEKEEVVTDEVKEETKEELKVAEVVTKEPIKEVKVATEEVKEEPTKKAEEEKEEPKVAEVVAKEVKEETKDKPKTDTNKKKSAADLILERIKNKKKNNQGELISKFLTEQPRIDVKKEPVIDEDLSLKSVKETEVVTERIAEIYALQGLKQKAIETYEKLILKYPEKNAYFASKIQELKNK